MGRIQKTFPTKYNKEEVRKKINENILTSPGIDSIINKYEWQNDILILSSKIGKGTITIFDYKIEIDIELNIFGKPAKKMIETTLDNEFKRLNP